MSAPTRDQQLAAAIERYCYENPLPAYLVIRDIKKGLLIFDGEKLGHPHVTFENCHIETREQGLVLSAAMLPREKK